MIVQAFQQLIVIYRRGNFVYHCWGCTSIYRLLSYHCKIIDDPNTDNYANGYIITWMLHQIFMYSNKVILLVKITILPTPSFPLLKKNELTNKWYTYVNLNWRNLFISTYIISIIRILIIMQSSQTRKGKQAWKITSKSVHKI